MSAPRRGRAPALVVTVDPGTLRNLAPWRTPRSDPAVPAQGQAFLADFRPLRLADGERLTAALPGSCHLIPHNGCHGDFFIEYDSALVDAIAAMRREQRDAAAAGMEQVYNNWAPVRR